MVVIIIAIVIIPVVVIIVVIVIISVVVIIVVIAGFESFVPQNAVAQRRSPKFLRKLSHGRQL